LGVLNVPNTHLKKYILRERNEPMSAEELNSQRESGADVSASKLPQLDEVQERRHDAILARPGRGGDRASAARLAAAHASLEAAVRRAELVALQGSVDSEATDADLLHTGADAGAEQEDPYGPADTKDLAA